jgi:hypothetical protein
MRPTFLGKLSMQLFLLGSFLVVGTLPFALGAPVTKPAKPKVVKIGDNVYLEIDGKQRRVIVKAKICLREGRLEGLLTRTMAKEHEYLLAADCDARHIHTALVTAGAKPGSPVVFAPKYKAAHGTPIKVSLRYEVEDKKTKKKKTVTVRAQEWIREAKSKKKLDKEWVFGGSKFIPNTDKEKPPIYIANHGDLICTVNMESAMLDLPVASPKTFEARLFEAVKDKIPDKDTEVEVILEPVPDKKKDKKPDK